MSTRPNVIFIMADDMGYGDLSVINQGINHTPALNDLYRQSLRLSQGYAASCVCAPSRAGFLTGRYPHRTGCTCLNEIHGLNHIAARETTIADLFGSSGYHTGLIGKWHCGHDGEFRPENRGFSHVETYHPQGMDYWKYTIDHNGTPEKADGKTYLTDNLTERALRYISNHQSEPFFLHLAYYAPHRPLQASDEKLAKYKDRDDLTEGQKRVYAMIESMDDGIGRIMNLLHETGLENNTIVIFTSDNGPDNLEIDGISPARENLGLRGCKYSVHDGGIRVPAMVRWPDGMLCDRDNHDLFHFIDFLPTLATACGVSIPQAIRLDGENRLAVWQDDALNVNPIRFWQWNRHYPYPNCNAAMRDGDWKLVYPKLIGYNQMSQANIDMILGKRPFETTRPQMLELGQPGKPMLFNIKDDPFEKNDLSLANLQRVGQMTSSLNDWCRDVMGDFKQSLNVQFG